MATLVSTNTLYRRLFISLTKQCKCTIANNVTFIRRNYTDDKNNEEFYDIVIAGGGMVGTTLACAIANNRMLESKNVLLLESNNKYEYKPQEKYSNRVVALNQQTRTLLSSIGAWQHIEAVRCCPVKIMQVWDACSDAIITFNEDYLSKELAYIVENDLLLHAVNTQLHEKPNVNVVYNAKVTNLLLPSIEGANTKIQLENGKQYETKLLVGADGVNSKVREAMNVQYVQWKYDQMGIVATLELCEPTENIVAWQRFLPTGPIALLPLTNTLSSLVWSLTTKEAKNLMKISEEEFVDNINKALWKVYPKDGIVESGMKALQQLLQGLSLQSGISRQLPPSVSKIVEGSRAAFPLGFGHSVSYVAPGTVLIGDAAHRVHPLAGQGVNLGFGDIIDLVKILADTVSDGSVFGNMLYLTKYETLRQRHNIPTMLAIDALHRLYKGTAAPIILARSLGLQITNAIPILKKALIQHASNQEARC
ncbi:PREDICTED: ubiquinone biosynthesis monooxygenase COQ6, mitochondrial [Polistes dominula]|uniref:Ubiquinone biosynthesis monooxygenase COQ6, mitochondrial n=1 Tax=Polistes dominula TaxID=743375 RepID=A0ABM1HT89_POLDO|nr:PREDICTED: ubiquinone biosynthesis monooxygenase COQ6, mitochondrial [Polistes dominula]